MSYVMVAVPADGDGPRELSIIAVVASNHFGRPNDLLFATTRCPAVNAGSGQTVEEQNQEDEEAHHRSRYHCLSLLA